ncbi:hypothetical protein ABPG75_008836 [Micractinium tetrahymenae]
MAEPVRFPDEEEGMPGIHLDIKHDLSSGGDPGFSGSFHGAGSGGAELVDPHKTNLSRIPSMGMDAAAGVRRGPGHAGAHPALYTGIYGGVDAGEGPGGGMASSEGGAASASERQGPEAGGQAQEQPAGVLQSAAEAVSGAVQSVKQAAGMGEE